MDCEKFESTMIDELYDELDELTSAAAKRHVAGCARCAAMLGGLRATRRVMSTAGGVPLVDPPPYLEDRILAATREAQKIVPISKRIARAISTAGSWAMRPQTAMAAVFLLMIGSSVVFLRGSKRAMSPAAQPMTVTAEGAPAASMEQLAKNEPIDTQAASGAHGYKKVTPPEPAATATAAASAVAMGGASADDKSGGVMDGLTNGQGRGDKGGALGQLGDNDEEKQKLDQGWGRRAAGPSNAGAIGGASNYSAPAGAPGAGGGGGYAQPGAAPPPAVAATAAPAKRAPPIVADRPTSPSPKPAAAVDVADPYAAPATQARGSAPDLRPATRSGDTKDAAKKEASALDAARANYTNKNYPEATRQFDQITVTGGDASAALWAARSVREGNGCGAALQRFDTVAGRQAGSGIGNDALLEGGQCYRQLGQFEAARARLVRLLTVPSHAARAQRELDAMSPKATAKPQPRKAPEPSQQQAPVSKDSAF